MRKVVLVLGVLGIFAAFTGAQTNTAQPNYDWAKKLFPGPRDKDFGTVARGAQLKHSFTMKNIYKVPLEITSLRPGCGCLTAVASKKSLQPGEEGTIDVNMNTRIFSGPKTVTLYVTVGPQYINTATLTVTANARQDVVVNPGEVNFGLVNRGHKDKGRVVEIEYSGSHDWKVLEVIKNNNAPFTVSIEEFKRSSSINLLRKVNDVGYRLQASLKPDAAPGHFREELILRTNDPANPFFTVPVEGNVQTALTLSPSLWAIGGAKVGDDVTKKVIVAGNGNRRFRITAIDGVSSDLRADFEDQEKVTHVVTLHCKLDTPGEFKKTLTIRTNLDGEKATVTIEASVQQLTPVAVDPKQNDKQP